MNESERKEIRERFEKLEARIKELEEKIIGYNNDGITYFKLKTHDELAEWRLRNCQSIEEQDDDASWVACEDIMH